MKILVIGGTQFVGRHFVEQAVSRGHEVTLFNRGNNPAPAGVERSVQGDRNEDLGRLADGDWDAVLDTSAYFPRQVREAARVLAGRTNHYTFISTISVYSDQETPLQDESAPLIELPDPDTEELTGESYGGLKVLCERTLARHYPADTLVVRPGVIVGPHDPTDRFSYWPVRVARGGEVLAPVGPELPVQWIDVRDLAVWLTESIERRLTGTFNAVSEADRFTMGELLETSRAISASDARFTWVSEQFLVEQEVGPFVQLPLWVPANSLGFSRIDGSAAQREGLRVRPLADTARATLEWRQSQSERERPWRAGLTAEREQELLVAWSVRARAHAEGRDY